MRARLATLLLIAPFLLTASFLPIAAPAVHAQTSSLATLPPPPPTPHVLAIDYVADQLVQVQATPGYQVTIELGGDERIENVALGDNGAWAVTANRRGDHLFVKPLQGGVTTNMVVVTDRRLYTFELSPLTGSIDQMAYAIRFRYPPAAGGGAMPMGAVAGYYTLRGDRAIRPSALSDDGIHTYMQWPASTALPAVYAIDGDAHETLVNGAMRDGTYVIDSVAARLVFRRDRRVAYAERVRPREER